MPYTSRIVEPELRDFLLPFLDTDDPIVIRMRHEPDAARARLLVSLGAGWIVDEHAPVCVRRCGHAECRLSPSAHEILQTTLCMRPGCPRDAASGSDTCIECARPRAIVGALPYGSVTTERLQLAEQAKQFRDNGLGYLEIAAELGISRSYASELCLDPDGAKSRARKDSYRQPCPFCSKPMTGTFGRTRQPTMCAECSLAAQHAERTWTPAAIVAAFQDFARTFGRPPAAADAMGNPPSQKNRFSPERQAEIEEARAANLLPVPATVQREFGSWAGALRAAGLEQPPTGGAGHRGRRLGLAQEATLELLEAGPQRTTDIAASRGVDVSSASQCVRGLLDRGFVEHLDDGRYALVANGQTIHREGARQMGSEYIVLSKDEDGTYQRAGATEAITPAQAIEHVADGVGCYVAILARNWHEHDVAPKTVFAIVEAA